jgi:hypothetical protein
LGAAVLAVVSGAGPIIDATGASRGGVFVRRHTPTRPFVSGSGLPPITYRNDNFRTGQNLNETILTPSTVAAGSFGLRFTDAVDGQIYAQPLYVPSVTISDGTHNVIYVATEFDSVYAFDADNPGPPLWHTSFLDSKNGITPVSSHDDATCGDLTPWIGISATPVIDPNTNTLYVVSKVKFTKTNKYQQQLHALDIATGLDKLNPVTISAITSGTGDGSNGGKLTFEPLRQNARSALTLANGVVYLSFASHCDVGPYHGWILGYDAATLSQVIVYNDSPNGSDAGIWQSGCGLGVDTNGDLIAITGNGTFETSGPRVDYGDSFLRLTPGSGTLSVSSFFTPSNQDTLNSNDLDLGSGGNLMLPDQAGPFPHLMVSAGKQGTIYLVNRDAMGGYNATTDQVVQELPTEVGGLWSTPAYWQGTVSGGLQNMIYTVGFNDSPTMFVISNGQIQTPPASIATNFVFGYPGASPVISANGTTGGILWAIDSSQWKTPGPAILYAFDATDLTNELWDSSISANDNPGNAVKFTNPTVANGKVYMGTATQLAVFGLPLSPTPTPTATASTTPTATASTTPTATATASPTATATSSATATPTPDPTPSPVVNGIEIKPTSISFPNEPFADTAAQSKSAKVTVTNRTGVTFVTFSTPTLSDGFVVTNNNCVGKLAPGKSCEIEVAFAPTALGMQRGTLLINSNAKSGNRPVKLKGKGVAPPLKMQPKTVDFGQIQASATTSQTITLINQSPVPITLTVAPAATPPYNVIANTCATIAPNGGTCTISVEFNPGSAGQFKGTLELRDNAAKSPQHIKLQGRAK